MGLRGKNMKKNILEYLEESARQVPEKCAFADLEKSCTYQELLMRAKRIGTFLARRLPGREPVPVFMEKSVDAIAALLGAVYAGCFYVVVDTRQPGVRIGQILKTLDAGCLVTSKAFESELARVQEEGGALNIPVYHLEEMDALDTDEQLLARRRMEMVDTDPLYGIFTSGSTGVPKGVLVGHRSVIDFMDCFTDLFGICREDVIGNQAPWDFDVSVKDIYSTLKTGATMEIIPRQMFSFPVQLLDFLCERKVTVLVWAVSALCMISALKGFTYKIPETVRLVLFSGEVMPVKQLNIWRKYLPEAKYVNLYGPTEITCNCMYYEVDREFSPGETLPLGKPFPNERVFLLDEEDHLVTETGKEGEICVAGTALALGYCHNPEAEKRAFVQNPLNKRYPEQIYRTGDLAMFNEQGEMVFASRKDFQIKHMGHRIELGEIETAMERIPGIRRCCCLFQEEKKRITAYYQGDLEKKEIAAKLKKWLPAYMIPNRFCQMETFPLNKNGKIDRKALAEQR